jgi:hypothetical protein
VRLHVNYQVFQNRNVSTNVLQLLHIRLKVASAFLELLHTDPQIDILDLTRELSKYLVGID